MSAPEALSAPAAYLGFPLRVSADGARQAGRRLHVKELVVQVLTTAPGERVFVDAFGIGVQRLVFSPMNEAMWARIETRLVADLAEVLRGDADTSTVKASVQPDAGQPEVLRLAVSYRLLAVDREETVELTLASGEPLDAHTHIGELR